MGNRFYIFVLLGTLITFTYSLYAANEELIQVSKTGKIVTLQPIANHHFNMEAPNQVLVENKPVSFLKKEKSILKFTASGNYELRVYVCDDQNTFCKEVTTHQLPSSQSGGTHQQNTVLSAGHDANQLEWIPNNSKKNLKDLFLQPSTNGKTVIVNFSAIWCPPCRRLHQETLNGKFLKNKAIFKNTLFIQYDRDLFETQKMMDEHQVKFIPTTIFFNDQGLEMDRLVGFEDQESFKKRLASLRNAPKIDEQSVQALRAYRSMDFQKAAQLFQNKPQFEKEEMLSQIRSRLDSFESIPEKEKVKSAQELIALVNKFAEKFPVLQSTLFVFNDVGMAFADDKSEEIKKSAQEFLQKMIVMSLTMLPQVKGQMQFSDPAWGTTLERSELISLVADAYEKLNLNALSKMYYQQALDEIGNPVAISSGREIERLYYLDKVGKLVEVEKGYLVLLEKFPKQYTFFYKYSRWLKSQNRLSEAKEMNRRGLEMSYGINKLDSILLQAELLKKSKETSELKKFVQVSLNEFSNVPQDSKKVSDRLEKLKAYLKE